MTGFFSFYTQDDEAKEIFTQSKPQKEKNQKSLMKRGN